MICLGTHDVEQGQALHKLFQTDFFRVVVVADVETVEICGALKVRIEQDEYSLRIINYGQNWMESGICRIL